MVWHDSLNTRIQKEERASAPTLKVTITEGARHQSPGRLPQGCVRRNNVVDEREIL